MSALDPLPGDPLGGAPLVEGRHTDAQVTRSLLGYLHSRPTRLWWLLFGTCMAGTVLLAVAMIVTFARGVGTWGVMIPVAWGFAITSFVWWIGIGHAGTLISAFLLLMTEKWRSSINRIAEAGITTGCSATRYCPGGHVTRAQMAAFLHRALAG